MTSSSDKENRRYRTSFTIEQKERLESEYSKENYVAKPKVSQLAAELDLSEISVKVWFQNRRMREKQNRMEYAWPCTFASSLPYHYQPPPPPMYVSQHYPRYQPYPTYASPMRKNVTKIPPTPPSWQLDFPIYHQPQFYHQNSDFPMIFPGINLPTTVYNDPMVPTQSHQAQELKLECVERNSSPVYSELKLSSPTHLNELITTAATVSPQTQVVQPEKPKLFKPYI